LRKLDTQSWPSRFSDVHRQVEKLRESINDKIPKR
jgi:hypothetical protein